MKSKFCRTFTNGIPLTLNESHNQFSEIFGRNLNFSAEFWQPFIDVEVFPNDTTHICGPLLGVILEFVNKFGLKNTTTGEHKDNFEMMEKRLSNLVLCPFPPIKAIFDGWNHSTLSRYVGDIAMVSILASKTQLQSIFHLLEVFDTNIWIYLVLLYLLTSSLSSLVDNDSGAFIEYFGVLFGQVITHWRRKERTSLLTMVWMYGSLIIMWAYSGTLLTFLVFPTPYDKIDSISDLAKRDLHFGAFDDETAFEFIKDTKQQYFEEFKDRFEVQKAGNVGKEQWEQRVLTGISNGTFALVSDQPFNDYYFATKLKTYPNLHRSKDNLIVLPYFIALSKFNSIQLNSAINQIICSLSESGIYEEWVRNTLDVNNDALRDGIVDLEQKKYQNSELDLQKFKVFLYVGFATVISSLIAFTFELIFKSKFICNKNLPTIPMNSVVIERRRHRHYKRFHLMAEYWIYGTFSPNTRKSMANKRLLT